MEEAMSSIKNLLDILIHSFHRIYSSLRSQPHGTIKLVPSKELGWDYLIFVTAIVRSHKQMEDLNAYASDL